MIPSDIQIGHKIQVSWKDDETGESGSNEAFCQTINHSKGVYYFVTDDCRLLAYNKRTEEITDITSDIEQTMSESIPLSELDNYSEGQQIMCVEGILTAIWEPREPNNPKFDPQQNAYLKDDAGTEHRLCIASRKHIMDHEAMKGKRVRFKCKKTGRGYTGVKMKVEVDRKDNTKVYRKIWVTATAIVEVIENGQPSQKTTTPPQKQAAPAGGGAAPATNTAPTDGNGSGVSTVKRRVYDYLRVLSVVREGYKATKEKLGLPEIPEEELRNIATFISMTYKGQYGAYQAPYFGEEKGAGAARQSTDAPAKEQPKQEAPKQEAPPKVDPPKEESKGWSDFVHTKSKKTLGEIFKSDKPKWFTLLKWALIWKGEAANARALQAALLLGMEQTKTPHLAVLEGSVMADFAPDGINPDSPDEWAKQTYGVQWHELTEGDVIQILGRYDEFLAEITKINDSSSSSGDGDDIPE